MKNNLRHYEFLRQIKKIRKPAAFAVVGEEQFLKDKVTEAILQKYSSNNNEFDLHSFYGDEANGLQIVEELETLPFMAKYKIVLLKNYHQLNAKEKSYLASYLENPYNSSIFILTTDKLDKRQKVDKIVAQKALNVICKKPYGPIDIERWLEAELRSRNKSMDRQGVQFFSSRIDLDFLVAANELEKLIIFTKDAQHISYLEVKECLGRSRVNDIFELQKALGQKKLSLTFKILENMMQNESSAVFIVTMLTRFFTQLWKINSLRAQNFSDSDISQRYLPEIYYKFRSEYLQAANNFNMSKIKHIFSLLLQADIDLKSLNMSETIILELLFYKILND
ncbi:MAG TPA: DNA polymerase III subunit delta [Candidatus Cloacimonas sp.]|jgi:DNA polymerase-3 subunit delta|nr:polymerase subunit delta [Candidatus Cloacimonadota bacterium]HCX72177.1 DNA polymerase III subunit delta [Candidatus Cloacimonas sp.]